MSEIQYIGTRIPFDVTVNRGTVTGWRTFRKFGENPDVDAGTEEMWPLGTVRTLPTSAAVASTVSSDAADDLGSTGAEKIMIEGLDSNYVEVSEEVTLNGVGAVTTTQTFLRVNRAYITQAGTGLVNAGNITVSVGGNAQAYIGAGEGQTLQSSYSVPAGHSVIIMCGDYMANASATASVRLWIDFYDPDTGVWRTRTLQSMVGATPMTGPILFTEKQDIRVRVVSTATNVECSATLLGYLVDNNYF
jgi:hypothetical protein